MAYIMGKITVLFVDGDRRVHQSLRRIIVAIFQDRLFPSCPQSFMLWMWRCTNDMSGRADTRLIFRPGHSSISRGAEAFERWKEVVNSELDADCF
jgi:hypothetical protein